MKSISSQILVVIMVLVAAGCQPSLANTSVPFANTLYPTTENPHPNNTSAPPQLATPQATSTFTPTAATLITKTLTPEIQAQPPATGMIAFYSNRDGNPEIYIMNTNGSNLTRLTNDPAFDDSPEISQDGKQVAFLTARHDSNPSFPHLKYEIYIVEVNGGNLRRLTYTEAAEDHPSWSPDGSKILFDADYDDDGFFEIYFIDLATNELTRLTENPANDQFAEWSPDSSQIAFSSDRNGNWDIFIMNSDGSDQHPLASSPNWELFPAWSPDGLQIAYTDLVPQSRNTDILVMNADGSQTRQLTDTPRFDENPAWSPEGSHIAFQTQRTGNFEIYVMNLDGSQQRPLAAHPADELWPSWGPETANPAMSAAKSSYRSHQSYPHIPFLEALSTLLEMMGGFE